MSVQLRDAMVSVGKEDTAIALDKSKHVIFAYDKDTDKISPVDPDTIAEVVSSAVTYTVGSGGDYSTLQEAIEEVSKLRAAFVDGENTVTLQLLSGYAPTSIINIIGTDLSFVKVTSVDSEVTLPSTFAGNSLLDVRNGGKSPLMDINVNANNKTSLGVYYAYAGEVNLAGSKTIKNASIGLHAGNGGRISAPRIILQSCTNGLFAETTGTISAVVANISGSTSNAVLATAGGKVDCDSPSFSNNTQDFEVKWGGIITADGATAASANVTIGAHSENGLIFVMP